MCRNVDAKVGENLSKTIKTGAIRLKLFLNIIKQLLKLYSLWLFMIPVTDFLSCQLKKKNVFK